MEAYVYIIQAQEFIKRILYIIQTLVSIVNILQAPIYGNLKLSIMIRLVFIIMIIHLENSSPLLVQGIITTIFYIQIYTGKFIVQDIQT